MLCLLYDFYQFVDFFFRALLRDGKHDAVVGHLHAAEEPIGDETLLQGINVAVVAYAELIEERLVEGQRELAGLEQLVEEIVFTGV